MGFVMRIRFDSVLLDNSLRNVQIDGRHSGYEFSVKPGYYRGLYLSCIEELAVTVDGKAVADTDIIFQLNGKEFAPCELKYQISEFWRITTPAVIRVHKAGGLEQGNHDIDLRLMFRSPYLPAPGATEPHTYVPIDSCENKIMMLNA